MLKNEIVRFAHTLAHGRTRINIYSKFLPLMLIGALASSCRESSEQKMIQIIADLNQKDYNSRNPFCPEAKVVQCDSLLKLAGRENDFYLLNTKAKLLLETGDEKQAVAIYKKMVSGADSSKGDLFEPDMGLAYMRLGERANCMLNHNRMSCTYPIRDNAIHVNQTGSRSAIAIYEHILKKHPADLESRWMLNIAYMTLGNYPDSVPKPFLIPDLK